MVCAQRDNLVSENLEHQGQEQKQRKWQYTMPSCMWSIWSERNKRCFEDTEGSIQKIKMYCLVLLYHSCKQNLTSESKTGTVRSDRIPLKREGAYFFY